MLQTAGQLGALLVVIHDIGFQGFAPIKFETKSSILLAFSFLLASHEEKQTTAHQGGDSAWLLLLPGKWFLMGQGWDG